MTTTSIDEPTPASDQAPGVGSMSSADEVPPGRDLLRALSCALLVALCVASPGSALVFAPFVPAIFAIRLYRPRAGSRRFVWMATAGSLLAAIGAAEATGGYVPAVVAALLLVPALGLVHARAARHDPIETPVLVEWPEPRLRTGLTPTIGAWLAVTVVVLGLAAPLVESPTTAATDRILESTTFYDDACSPDGALADEEEYCAELLAQRDSVVDAVEDRGPELLAALVAVFAFGAAATAHLIVLVSARTYSDRVRRRWRLRELEFHWSAAYVLAAGLVAFLLAGDGDGVATVTVRSVGVGLAVLGALAMASQGIGLVAWMFTRGSSPTWYRFVLVVFAMLVLPVTLTLLFFFGVLDMALHPRRRAAKSGNVPGRGSGS